MPQMIYMDPPRHTGLAHDRLARVHPEAHRRPRGPDPRARRRAPRRLLRRRPLRPRRRVRGAAPGHRDRGRARSAFRPSTSSRSARGPSSSSRSAAPTTSPRRRRTSTRSSASCSRNVAREPRDDLMSALIAAEADGEHLTDEELLGFSLPAPHRGQRHDDELDRQRRRAARPPSRPARRARRGPLVAPGGDRGDAAHRGADAGRSRARRCKRSSSTASRSRPGRGSC